MRFIRTKFTVALIILAASAAGVAVHEWGGIFARPVMFCAWVVVLGITWFVLSLVMGFLRLRARIRRIRARVRPLSTEQLYEIMRTPAHPDSQFALVELMRRGVDARPTKEQLFGMLTSGNSVLCGQAMTNLQVFYPELPIPDGASNLDPPELWQSRIAAFRIAE